MILDMGSISVEDSDPDATLLTVTWKLLGEILVVLFSVLLSFGLWSFGFFWSSGFVDSFGPWFCGSLVSNSNHTTKQHQRTRTTPPPRRHRHQRRRRRRPRRQPRQPRQQQPQPQQQQQQHQQQQQQQRQRQQQQQQRINKYKIDQNSTNMDMQSLPTSALGGGAAPSPPTSLQFVGRGMEATVRIKQIEKIRKLIHTHVKLS